VRAQPTGERAAPSPQASGQRLARAPSPSSAACLAALALALALALARALPVAIGVSWSFPSRGSLLKRRPQAAPSSCPLSVGLAHAGRLRLVGRQLALDAISRACCSTRHARGSTAAQNEARAHGLEQEWRGPVAGDWPGRCGEARADSEESGQCVEGSGQCVEGSGQCVEGRPAGRLSHCRLSHCRFVSLAAPCSPGASVRCLRPQGVGKG